MQPASMHLHDPVRACDCLSPSVTLSQWPVKASACRGASYHIGATLGEMILGKI